MASGLAAFALSLSLLTSAGAGAAPLDAVQADRVRIQQHLAQVKQRLAQVKQRLRAAPVDELSPSVQSLTRRRTERTRLKAPRPR